MKNNYLIDTPPPTISGTLHIGHIFSYTQGDIIAEYQKYLGKDYDLTVYCSSKSYPNQLTEYNNAKLVYIPLNANGVQSIPYDIFAIFKALFYADVLLILGVSGCIVLPFVKCFSRKKIIVNIDGMLSSFLTTIPHCFSIFFLKLCHLFFPYAFC